MKLFKIIPTRLLMQLFFIFLIMQVGFTFIFVFIGYFTNDFLSRIPIWNIPFLLPYIFPFAQSWGAQFVMVFTTAMVYCRITQARENLALQSSGISMWCMMFPSFVLAFVLSVLSFFLMDVHLSWGMNGAQKVFFTSLESIIYSTLENESSCTIIDDIFLSVDRVDDGKMYGLYLTSKTNSNSWACTAKSAELRIGPASQIVRPDEVCYMKMTNEVYHYDPKDKSLVVKISFNNFEIQYNSSQISTSLERTILFSMDELRKLQERASNRVADMSLAQLNDFVEEQQQKIDSMNMELALQSALFIQTGNMEGFKSERLKNELYKTISNCKRAIHRAKIEPTRRLAFAFNCFFLTWVCVPLSLIGRNVENQKVLVFISIRVIPLLLVFSLFYIFILNFVKHSDVSPLILWVPQILLLVLGCWLIRKAL